MKVVPVWKILQKLIFIRVSVTHSKRVADECTDEVMDVGTWNDAIILEPSSCHSEFLLKGVILHIKPENNI